MRSSEPYTSEMKKNDLLLILLIICTAAAAVVTGALKVPSDQEGTFKALFVSEETYNNSIKDKEKIAFDGTALRFEGSVVPFEEETDTVYIPQSMDDNDWTGNLQAAGNGGKVCILADGLTDPKKRQGAIEDGTGYRIAVIFKGSFMEGRVVFSGLPEVSIQYEDGEIQGKEIHEGRISVLDPYRKEYMSFPCSFHVRGATSIIFEKKSYRIELHDAVGNNEDASLLGLREDDDWILNAVGTDKSLAREKICYDLWKKLGLMEEDPVPAPEMEYTELFINGEYMGVYGLMYPVDRKLMDMKPGDLLYKVNTWKEEADAPGRLTDHNGEREIFNQNGTAYVEIEYPGKDSGPYIWDPLEAYQDFVFETQDPATLKGKGITLNTENFILHELFCELTRAGDNTWKNLFMAAYKDENGGYTLSETIWDLNYTFGDAFTWDPENGNTVFLPESTDLYKLRYDRDYGYTALMIADEGIKAQAAEKWKKWREEGIGPELIREMFEEERAFLIRSGAMRRNEDRWPGSTDPDNSAIYEWLEGRFEYLDSLHGSDH